MTGPTSVPAPTGTTSERIHAQLRADILGGRHPAGEPLPSERRLSQELGASRHVVREALKRLQQSGLVSISHGGATRVRDWRRHGGLELLLDLARTGDAPEALHAPRGAMELRACIGADAARRCADRASAEIKTQLQARAEQLAALDALEARNAHYELLWDLVVEGADNVAYRLAFTTLVAGQRIADVTPLAVAAELRDTDAIRALVSAIALGDAEVAHKRGRDLLERSIPAD